MGISSELRKTDLSNDESEQNILNALRGGDESAFMGLVELYHRSMFRIALVYVHEPGIAEDVVQDAWLGVLKGLPKFEGRSSLKTWIFSILTNCAKSRYHKESKSIPFSELVPDEEDEDEPLLASERFRPPDYPQWPNNWLDPPKQWSGSPEEYLLSQEIMQYVQTSISALPASQQAIITLRDLNGWSAEEVCNVLDLSETNQRVLLHRARAKVRRDLAYYFMPEAKL